MKTALANAPDLELGAGVLRPSTCEFTYPGGVRTLEPQVMQVLLVLAGSKGRVVSRDTLVEQCWDGRSISEDAINRVMSRIRQLASATGAFSLTTIRSVGYRVEAAHDAASPRLVSETRAAPIAGGRPLRAAAVAAGIIVAILALAGVGILAWPLVKPAGVPPAIRHEAYSIAVLPGVATSPDRTKALSHLGERLRLSVSRMSGLRVVDTAVIGQPGQRSATDLVLNGDVDTADGQETITLSLDDGRTGVRVWGATFDNRGPPGLGAEERAISSATRYLALWLGDRRAGLPAAREPESPDTLALVAKADRKYLEGSEARELRDWALAKQRSAEARALSDEALAREPGSVAALMLRYRVSILPFHPRDGENEAEFRARQTRAADAVNKALAINPDDPEVLIAAAKQLESVLHWDDARRLLDRAVALAPNSAEANTWYAYSLGLTGKCDAGLRHAQLASALDPERTWRGLTVPRLMLCAGRSDEAVKAYLGLVRRDRTHLFVLGDLHLILLTRRQPSEMRAVATQVREQVWGGKPPPLVAARLERLVAAADAIEGRPQRYLEMIRRDEAAVRQGSPARVGFSRSLPDALFVLALEYAHAGSTEEAMSRLEEAVRGGSLYLPWALPHGSAEFPSSVRRDPRYFALWRSSPQLSALMEERRRSVAQRTAPASAGQ
ncbi:winged helix-turn-helix domain-containing protein [Caulobacter hibisci]|uniref:Winged helix-turn-helix domain-containing protein n=1 Tax=Caulobacter hibisci TaxID=2035993 RepID=A0ABS0T4L5_9CAUL|nr:winged helix-turn-helix domain-containing protein [Caulobacter hibisci]MBI1686431.1 winged helix-turn-helix domain-containing protein [Caulobacter hibisci]